MVSFPLPLKLASEAKFHFRPLDMRSCGNCASSYLGTSAAELCQGIGSAGRSRVQQGSPINNPPINLLYSGCM